MNCPQYRPQPSSKRRGLCEFQNVYGPHGCDRERGPWCEGPSDLPECECPRCSGEGYKEDYSCPKWRGLEWYREQGGPFNCETCDVANSYGRHGCPLCLD